MTSQATGGPVLGDPCQPLGTFPIIATYEGLLDRTIPTSDEGFAGTAVEITKAPLSANCAGNAQGVCREKPKRLGILP